jgi:hypothetical protein
MAAGCDGHLSKPISKQRLLSAIEQYAPKKPAGPPPIRVQIRKGLEALIPDYWAGRKKDLVEMQRLLEAGDFERLRILSHNLKGSAASYGFTDLSPIGARLQDAAIERDQARFREGLDQFEDYVNRVQIDAIAS